MAAAEISLLAALEDAVQHGSPSRRTRMLRRITDLFLSGAAGFHDEHVQVFDDVYRHLVAEIEDRTRAQLAQQLSAVGNAPPELMRQLARDDNVAVAGPVLQHSGRLGESELVELATRQSQAHLLAISQRGEIGHAVTDVIVRRGNRDVIRTVAGNPGAKLSQAGFAALVKKAESDGVLAEKVGGRRDIPPAVFKALVAQAAEVVQKRLLANAAPEIRAALQGALTTVSGQVEAAAAPRDFTAAKQAVLKLQRTTRLDEDTLLAFAQKGQFEEAVASLAAMCKVPLGTVERVMGDDRTDPVLIVCRAAELAWPTVEALLKLRARGSGMASLSLEQAGRNYERLSLATAQQVIQFWGQRQAAARKR